MAIIKPTYNIMLERLVTVKWANVSSADTASVHVLHGRPDLLTVQAEGIFAGGTRANLTGSVSNVAFVSATDMTQTAISFTANGATGVLEPFTYWKPVISGGSSDNVTVSLSYWADE